jgi:truncated hemoglobin YjbI
MDEAMDETNVPVSIKLELNAFFTMVAHNMRNRQE